MMIRFGVYTVDGRAGEIFKKGKKLEVQPQPLQVLVSLLENAGEVVTREELRQKIWPVDTFVDFEHSLNTAIKKLRQALGDNAARPKYIETLPRRGYRFRGKVEAKSEKTGANVAASVGTRVARPGQLAGKVFTLEAEKGIPCVMAPMDENCRKEWERLQSLEDDVGIAVMIAEKRLLLVEGGHRVRVLAAEDKAQWCEVRIMDGEHYGRTALVERKALGQAAG
ncbi:MAG TPA: winged helix-turn-helix domain-containing protein [Candidatus Acidoferrum sp.]|jgi:DNA-binding winged helix-turn-helix (wHTH) protein